MEIKVIPISEDYREGYERIKWDDNSRVEKATKKEFEGTSEDYFKATEEDIKKLKEEIAKRFDYAERAEEQWEANKRNNSIW